MPPARFAHAVTVPAGAGREGGLLPGIRKVHRRARRDPPARGRRGSPGGRLLRAVRDGPAYRARIHGSPGAPPQVIGHEIAGTVAEVGTGVNGLEPGDKVVVRPLDSRGQTAADKGISHICRNLKFLGIDTPGAFQGSWTAFTIHQAAAGRRPQARRAHRAPGGRRGDHRGDRRLRRCGKLLQKMARVENVVLWMVAGLLAAAFLAAGMMKLSGTVQAAGL